MAPSKSNQREVIKIRKILYALAAAVGMAAALSTPATAESVVITPDGSPWTATVSRISGNTWKIWVLPNGVVPTAGVTGLQAVRLGGFDDPSLTAQLVNPKGLTAQSTPTANWVDVGSAFAARWQVDDFGSATPDATKRVKHAGTGGVGIDSFHGEVTFDAEVNTFQVGLEDGAIEYKDAGSIPEPASMALFAMGAMPIAMALRRRRRRGSGDS